MGNLLLVKPLQDFFYILVVGEQTNQTFFHGLGRICAGYDCTIVVGRKYRTEAVSLELRSSHPPQSVLRYLADLITY